MLRLRRKWGGGESEREGRAIARASQAEPLLPCEYLAPAYFGTGTRISLPSKTGFNPRSDASSAVIAALAVYTTTQRCQCCAKQGDVRMCVCVHKQTLNPNPNPNRQIITMAAMGVIDLRIWRPNVRPPLSTPHLRIKHRNDERVSFPYRHLGNAIERDI